MDKQLVERIVKSVLPSYVILDKLGEGSFGAVYKMKDALKERAVKIILLAATRSVEKGGITNATEKIERDFRHIIDSYERIACEEIVTVYDFYKVFEQEDAKTAKAYAIVVMEIYPTNLLDFIIDDFAEKGKHLDIAHARSIINKLAVMLDNLHEKRGFLFEDLKPENLLIKEVNGDFKVVVGDIGGLKSVGSASSTGSQVTLNYSAPEVIRQGQRPNVPSIIYSFGLISYYILNGALPYEDSSVTDRMDMIRNVGLVYSRSDMPNDLKDILQKCLSFNAQDRFTTFGEVIACLNGTVQAAPAAGFAGATMDLGALRQNKPVAEGTIDINTFRKDANPLFNRPQVSSTSIRRPEASPSQSMSTRLPARSESKNLMSITMATREEAKKEIKSLIIKKGKMQRIKGDSFKVIGNIMIEEGATLVLEDCKFYFDESSGIVSTGVVKAKNVLFEAADFSKGWKNVLLISKGISGTQFESCQFRFGRGRTGKEIIFYHDSKEFDANENYTYGGSIFIMDAGPADVLFKDCKFFKSMTHDGGGFYVLSSSLKMEFCEIDFCTTTLCGAGLYLKDTMVEMKNTKFSKNISNKEGGGIYCENSKLNLEGVDMTECSSKYLDGGGIASQNCSFNLLQTKFNTCSGIKGGGASLKESDAFMRNVTFNTCKANEFGAIFTDDITLLDTAFVAYSKCTPNDTNYVQSNKRKKSKAFWKKT